MAVRQVLCLGVEVDLDLTEGSLLLVAGGTEVFMFEGMSMRERWRCLGRGGSVHGTGGGVLNV
jgi:hypothetical protein